MKSSTIFSIGTFLFGIALFVIVIKKIGLEQIAETVSMISKKQLLIIIFLNFIGIFASIYRWKIILQAIGFPVKWTKITMAKLVGLAINYLTPGVFLGGEPFKALYLKTELDIPLRKSAVSIIIDEALFLSSTLIVIIIGLVFLFHQTLLSQKLTITILGTLAAFIIIFFLFFHRVLYKKSHEKGFFSYLIHIFGLNKIKLIANFSDKITEIENNLSIFFSEHKKTLYLSILLSIAENIMYLASFWLTVLYLGYWLNIQTILSIVSTIYINYLIPIPGALGSLEASQSYIFGLMGMKESVGLGFTLITRLVSLASVVLGLIIIAYAQIKILRRSFGRRTGISANKIKSLE